ncbi:MAG: HEAT repeat domain-containing protein [Synechococcales cyanobacterium RM1_1_8]|nr:HEAT repeat domain-containing protein [Synechococcales cyanobacterium RM1_1_8]
MDPLDQVPIEDAVVDADEMLALLKSADPTQVMIAARAFCEIEDARAVGPLLALLGAGCPMTRVSAAYALGRNIRAGKAADGSGEDQANLDAAHGAGPQTASPETASPETASSEDVPDIVEALIAQLRLDWSGYVRKGIVWALGRSGDRRALSPLLNALKTDIAAVRLWAASALGQMPGLDFEASVKAMPPLIAAMRQDPVAVVRSNCAWSVGELCINLPSNVVYATAVDALIETLVEDEDMGVREDAKAALLNLGDPRSLQMIEALQSEGLLW